MYAVYWIYLSIPFFFLPPDGNWDLSSNFFMCEGQGMSKSLLIEASGSCREGKTGIVCAWAAFQSCSVEQSHGNADPGLFWGEWELNPPSPGGLLEMTIRITARDLFVVWEAFPVHCGMGNGADSLMACCGHGEHKFLELFKLNPEYSGSVDFKGVTCCTCCLLLFQWLQECLSLYRMF